MGLAALVALGGIGVALALTGGKSGASGISDLHLVATSSRDHLTPPPPAGPFGPEGVPIPEGALLAPPGAPQPGQTVSGIQCQTTEQVLFHIHAHLTIFVDGKQRQVPYGIGIAPPRQVQSTPNGSFVGGGACFSWLHTHARDGIIHIESPVRRTYTLGNFFDIWKQPLAPRQVGPALGTVNAFVNGKLYKGNPRTIPLLAHEQIQLDVGQPLIGQQTIASWKGL